MSTPDHQRPYDADFLYSQAPDQELRFDRSALKDNELVAQNPELQVYIEDKQARILEHPARVHVNAIIGPSGTGKSTIDAQVGRVMERDRSFLEDLRLTTHPDRQLLVVHISCAKALDTIAQKHGITMPELSGTQRAEATDLMADSLTVLSRVFYDDPRFSVVANVDGVGVTSVEDNDLGTSLVERLQSDDRMDLLAPKPNSDVEELALNGRDLAKKISAGEMDGSLDEYMREHNIDTGLSLDQQLELFLTSIGGYYAWSRQWANIRQLVEQNDPVIFDTNVAQFKGQTISDEEFLLMDHPRYDMYAAWLPERVQELGVNPDRLRVISNPRVKGQLHTHMGRIYGPGKTRHFPYQLLLKNRRPLSQYDRSDVLSQLSVKGLPSFEQ